VKPPDYNLRRELSKIDLSFEALSEIVIANASDEDFAQPRRDWRVIDALIKTAKMINWNVAAPVLEARIKLLAGAPPDPPSIRARKAQRVRPLPPLQFIVALRSLRHESVGRATMLPTLMAFRCSRYFSSLVSVALAGAESWFDGLPRLEPASAEAPASEPGE